MAAVTIVFTTAIGCINAGTYQQSKMWSGSSFFDGWEFETIDDPTHGTVDYQPQSSGLAFYSSATDSVIIKVDTAESATSRGRKSVRIKSHDSFNEGLFILDTNRIPWGCGARPAFSMLGLEWPSNGEIDVIEGANNDAKTTHRLRTADSCDFTDHDTTGLFTGSWTSSPNGDDDRNCWVEDPSQRENEGCSVSAAEGTHGESWTNGGGGVTVLLWSRTVGVKIWDLQRSAVPLVFAKNTTTVLDAHLEALGTPAAFFPFGSACAADSFLDNQIVMNIALCGDSVEDVWSSSGCASSTGYSSCSDFVRNNPTAFDDAFWDINWLKVFQSDSPSFTAELMVANDGENPLECALIGSAVFLGLVACAVTTICVLQRNGYLDEDDDFDEVSSVKYVEMRDDEEPCKDTGGRVTALEQNTEIRVAGDADGEDTFIIV